MNLIGLMENFNQIQKKILTIYEKQNGKLPTFRELAKLLNLSSTNTVHYHVSKLKKMGYLDAAHADNAVLELNFKNILFLENKKGVYVLLENKIPFFVSSTDNLTEEIFSAIKNNEKISEKIKNSNQKIMIAFYLIEDESERKDLEKHLIEFYSKQKIFLL